MKKILLLFKYIWYLILVILIGIMNILYAIADLLKKNGYSGNAGIITAVLWIGTLISNWGEMSVLFVLGLLILGVPMFTIASAIVSIIITSCATAIVFVFQFIPGLYEDTEYTFKNIRYDLNNEFSAKSKRWRKHAKHKGKECAWAEASFQSIHNEYENYQKEKAGERYRQSQAEHKQKQQEKAQAMSPREKALELFGLKEGFTQKELRKKYLTLSKKWHPDNHKAKDREVAAEKMKAITEAYSLLHI